MSSLEEVALRTLASYGLPGERMEGLTGATTAHEPQLEGSWREGNAAGVPNPNPDPNADPNPDADPNPNPNPDPDPNH